jgi:hypothetical protein
MRWRTGWGKGGGRGRATSIRLLLASANLNMAVCVGGGVEEVTSPRHLAFPKAEHDLSSAEEKRSWICLPEARYPEAVDPEYEAWFRVSVIQGLAREGQRRVPEGWCQGVGCGGPYPAEPPADVG